MKCHGQGKVGNSCCLSLTYFDKGSNHFNHTQGINGSVRYLSGFIYPDHSLKCKLCICLKLNHSLQTNLFWKWWTIVNIKWKNDKFLWSMHIPYCQQLIVSIQQDQFFIKRLWSVHFLLIVNFCIKFVIMKSISFHFEKQFYNGYSSSTCQPQLHHN